ncbi:MAG: CPBP family intramembrane metalloprotease [Actinomycetaceae bacterium]|nr:CPBP family intramembrane metalloprotease [Actinomycetaceae bacterium]
MSINKKAIAVFLAVTFVAMGFLSLPYLLHPKLLNTGDLNLLTLLMFTPALGVFVVVAGRRKLGDITQDVPEDELDKTGYILFKRAGLLRPEGGWLRVLAWAFAAFFGVLLGVVLTLVLGHVIGLNPVDVIDQPSNVQQSLLGPGADTSRVPDSWVILLGGLISAFLAAFSINALVALGEEIGWRGWLTTALKPLGFWPSAVVIGAIWGLWHAPINAAGYNYPDAPRPVAIVMFILFCVCFGALLQAIRERSQSLWPVAVAHGTLNATVGFFMLVSLDTTGSAWLWFSPNGLLGSVVFLCLALAVKHLGTKTTIGTLDPQDGVV